jgi:FPC/CPF motif-containing protein YcgG
MTLICQSEFASPQSEVGDAWKIQAFHDIRDRLDPPSNFPCLFSQTAFRKSNLLFSFVHDLSENSMQQSASELKDYVDRCEGWDGTLSSAEPLLVIFNPNNVHADECDTYNAIGWNVLQRWHALDPSPWPSEVSQEPSNAFWTMCFAGTQLFVNMSHPAHIVRKSRNLGGSLTFVVNPRERFDIVAGDNVTGRQVRRRIRDRILDYDGQGHSPDLGSYQAGELEWPQYGLNETNEPRSDTCPFQMRTKVSPGCTNCGSCDNCRRGYENETNV